MRKLCFCGSVLALVLITSQLFAYDLYSAGGSSGGGTPFPEPYKTITNEATALIPQDTLALDRIGSPAFAVGDTVEISLSGGATFADTNYVFEPSIGGAGIGDLTWATLQTVSPAGKPSITFILKETTLSLPPPFSRTISADTFILSGNAFAGQPVNINLPQVDGLDVYITFTVRDLGGTLKGSVQHLLFDSTLPPTPSESDYKGAIRNILSANLRAIASQSPNLSGLMTGQGFGNSNVSDLINGYIPIPEELLANLTEESLLSLPFYVGIKSGQGSFAASMSQFNDEPTNANFWVKGRWQYTNDKRGGNEGDSDFGLLMVGADYRYSLDTLFGVLAQYDFYESSATGLSAEGKGWGWMMGPYFVTRIDDSLILDVRIAWGRSDNEINVSNKGWDSFDGERWQVEANLTGDMTYGEWYVAPRLGFSYIEEEQKAFTSSKRLTATNKTVGAQTVSLGNLSFGPEISRSWNISEEATMRSFVAAVGLWEYDAPDIIHIDGRSINTEKLRARAEIGSELTFNDDSSVYVKYAFDGIGLSGYEAHSVEVSARRPINVGFLPNNSYASLRYNVCDAGTSTGNIKYEFDF
ncbi:outer membrane autotransporter barrel domain-containing protein [Malonomonas rubra DSM 5091]|uniref:Outer membrane autotransporter barrel domain-containing protein n=1 Tax=Malonomonas rubra DSM 5091 TaxID=1122189 RepID=A0A1M6B9I4_MALRU|nr:autotransporter outer membrane beta-barrel domain-containing protein [Malonomonas rubra]SHI45400.1 outer membrane autotransporter barrel domain-containing protein [Malonomonas rubra DSM 5091]